jgi:imidazolonepropionase-like amidohydrolase
VHAALPHGDHADRGAATWVRLGMTPMQAIAGATRWPARFLKKEKELGTRVK